MALTKSLFENEHYINKVWSLLKNLNIEYIDISKYILAFVHRSLINERPDLSNQHNERLEFLWDAVLEMVITNNLYLDFPDTPEWILTDYRSSIVKWVNLAKISLRLKFYEYLILWKWEELSGWRKNDYLLANCVEAFLWALYLDLWYEEAKKFALKYIYSTLEEILSNEHLKDYKSLLQEYTQRVFFITPEYRVLSESWLDHEKIYVSWVFLKETKIWEWFWQSKKKSQISRAGNAFLNKENIILK